MKEFEVYENNGGGLILVVYNDYRQIEYVHSGYEFYPGNLTEDIENIKAGNDSVAQWSGNELDYLSIDQLNDLENGKFGDIIADETGIYPNVMGAAGKKEFGI